MTKKAIIILGNQLFPQKLIPKDSLVYMAEDYGLCTFVKHHKQKIALFLTAMRQYAEELKNHGYEVCYVRLKDKSSYEENLESFLAKKKIESLSMFEIEDHFMDERIQKLTKKCKIPLHIIPTPMFMVSRSEFEAYLKNVKRPFMKTFYEGLRKQTEILMEKGKPLGGKFSYDDQNRKKLPRDYAVTARKNRNKPDGSVLKLIDKHFGDHPGETADFQWATTRKEALARLQDFLRNHFVSFGDYQDAIVEDEPFLNHSLISPYINLGLLTPREVAEKAVDFGLSHNVPLNSIEGFVRQVIGWREFVRGIYHNFDRQMQDGNFWNHTRSMTDHWYTGETGLPPLDSAIRNALKYGYTHHIERLMVLANLMNLCELDPKQVYRWFMEMFVDSSDWVMAANVYGMGLMSDGGIFATKPYVSGSNYILKMSHYKKGPWTDIWDGLYWRFVEKQIEFFSSNPRMGMMVRQLEKMKPERRKTIFTAAEAFLKKVTCNAS